MVPLSIKMESIIIWDQSQFSGLWHIKMGEYLRNHDLAVKIFTLLKINAHHQLENSPKCLFGQLKQARTRISSNLNGNRFLSSEFTCKTTQSEQNRDKYYSGIAIHQTGEYLLQF